MPKHLIDDDVDVIIYLKKNPKDTFDYINLPNFSPRTLWGFN